MNARKLQYQLRDLVEGAMLARHDGDDEIGELAAFAKRIRRIATYDEVGMLTRDKGLVIEYHDGSEYQLTIVESVSAGDDDDDGEPNSPPRLADQTPVCVRSEHFAETCEGVITQARYDDGWLYRIDVTSGDRLDAHRNRDGELWVCDFELVARQEKSN